MDNGFWLCVADVPKLLVNVLIKQDKSINIQDYLFMCSSCAATLMVDDILTVDTFSSEATERNATVDEFVKAGKLKNSLQKVV